MVTQHLMKLREKLDLMMIIDLPVRLELSSLLLRQ